MIHILDRYISKVIMLATGLITLIVASVMLLIMLLQELKTIGSGDYEIGQAIYFVLLRLPNELYHFAPILVLLGSIVGLSILSSYRELAVIRTSGFSVARMIYSVLGAALVLVFFMSAIGELFAPRLSYHATMHKENARNAGQAVVTAAGVWLHVDNNFIHVQRVVKRQLLEGVTRYQFDNQHRLQAAYFAKTLSLQGEAWQMNDVVKTTFYDNQTKSQSYSHIPWDLQFHPNLLNVGVIDANEMSLSKLNTLIRYLKQNGLQSNEYQYEFWQRLLQPILSLIMVFLTIPFVLSTLNTATLAWRLMMGILIGFIFFISNAFLGQLCIVYQLPAFLAALLPLLLFGMIGLVLINKIKYA